MYLPGRDYYGGSLAAAADFAGSRLHWCGGLWRRRLCVRRGCWGSWGGFCGRQRSSALETLGGCESGGERLVGEGTVVVVRAHGCVDGGAGVYGDCAICAEPIQSWGRRDATPRQDTCEPRLKSI